MMKRFLILILLLLITGAAGLFAVDITATLPTISGFGAYDATDAQNELTNTIIPLAEDAVAKFDTMDDMADAFGNANSYAAHGATQRGLMGYKFLTIAVGTMVGFQMPTADFSSPEDMLTDIEDDGDLYFGAGFQALTVSVGLNAGFLVDGLYLSAKVGKFTVDTDEIEYDSSVFGLLANYQIVDPFSIGIVKWRGIQVGSGLIYYNTTSNMIVNVDPVVTAVDVDGVGPAPNVDLYLDPTLDVEVTASGLMMPIDVISGIRFLWIVNLNFGLGVDLNLLSKSEIALKADGTTYFDEAAVTALGATQTPGTVKVSGGTEGDGAKFLRPRAMLGLGFALGPLKLDIPFTYYFDGTGPGTNIGITGALTL